MVSYDTNSLTPLLPLLAAFGVSASSSRSSHFTEELLNVYDVDTPVAVEIERARMGRPDDARNQQRTTKWYLNAYLHADRDDVLPLEKKVLDGLQFGGKRNYGYGKTRFKETQVVDLHALDYSQVRESEGLRLELVTPFVLESEYPDSSIQCVPWWWSVERDELRERTEQIVEQRELYTLQTPDHGQVVTYKRNRPIETAKNSVLRVGSHSKYGFGEFRVIPVSSPQ